MEFTYLAYGHLIELLRKNNYEIVGYPEYKNFNKTVILRHDIDMDMHKAVELAQLENELGVKSTYFVLLSSDFYNVFSKKNETMLKKIIALGHTVGLHFDEVKYGMSQELTVQIEEEIDLLEKCVDCEVTTVSMHRPSKEALEANWIIKQGNVINSYSNEFFHDFKYVSDSRRNWREDVYNVVECGAYQRLHILTHPIWYNMDEVTMKDCLNRFVKKATEDRYDTLADNIRDIQEVLRREEIFR